MKTIFLWDVYLHWASQVKLVVKNPPACIGDLRDVDSVPGLGRSPGIGNGNPLQYACLENSRAWQATLMRLQSDITERLNRTDLTFKFATAEEKGNFYPFLAA